MIIIYWNWDWDPKSNLGPLLERCARWMLRLFDYPSLWLGHRVTTTQWPTGLLCPNSSSVQVVIPKITPHTLRQCIHAWEFSITKQRKIISTVLANIIHFKAFKERGGEGGGWDLTQRFALPAAAACGRSRSWAHSGPQFRVHVVRNML